MPINVTYGDVAAYGQLGMAAGQAAAERTAQEQLLAVQEAQANRQAQTETQLTMQANQQQFQREMAQFEVFVRKEELQQGQAWKVEEQDIRRRHDLEMQLNEEDFKYNQDLQEWTRKNSIRQRKMEALEQARKDNIIDAEQFNSLKLANELDIEPYPESVGLAGRSGGGKNDMLAQLMKQGEQDQATAATAPGGVSPEQIRQVEQLPQKPTGEIVTPEAVQQAIVNILPALPPAEQKELKAVIALGNPAITQKAFERLQALGVGPGKPAKSHSYNPLSKLWWTGGKRPPKGNKSYQEIVEENLAKSGERQMNPTGTRPSNQDPAPREARQAEAYAGIPESFIGATMLETERIKQLLNQGMDEEEVYQYFLKRGSNLRQPPLLGR
jgi:alkylated DNA nucleotide flippase Atl1